MTRKEMETRRINAARDLMRGESVRSVARRYGVSHGSVYRWLDMTNSGGVEALELTKAPGRPFKLGEFQRERLRDMIENSDHMTWGEIQIWINDKLGVLYHRDSVVRLLQRMGVSRNA